MPFVGADPSFDFEPQRLKNLAIHKEAAEIRTIRNKSDFDFKLLNWKQSTLFNAHTPLPADDPRLVKPSPYIVVTVDEAKHMQRFTEYWNNGLLQLAYDFYVETPAALPDSTWDLTPKNPAPPVNAVNPIGSEDPGMGAPGWYNNVGGDDLPVGEPFKVGDKTYYLVRLRDNPFAPGKKILRWALEGVAKPETVNH